MSCPHEAWERNTASEADALCPLCLKAMLDLAERRLASSEQLRDGLVGVIHRQQAALSAIIERAEFKAGSKVSDDVVALARAALGNGQ